MSATARTYAVALAAALVGGLLAAPPARADNASTGPVTVDFDVSLAVAPRCGFASGGLPASSVSLGDLAVAGSRSVGFGLDCNTPFLFRAASQNGGLFNAGVDMTGVPAAAFTATRAYDVSLALGVRRIGGAADTISRSCSAMALAGAAPCAFHGAVAGQGLDTNDGVAIAGDAGLPASSLTVEWSAPVAGAPTPVAGTYSDTITISVEVAA